MEDPREKVRSPAANGARGTGGASFLSRLLPVGYLTQKARIGVKQVLRKQVPNQARHAFRIDLIASLLAGLYTGAVFPFVGIIARDQLNASPTLLALIGAAPFLGNLMALFWARAMEGRPKVPFVKWAHLGARLIVVLSLFAVGAWPFALVISMCQIVGTAATPAYAAVMKDVYPDDQRGRLLGYTRASILAAQVVSTLLAGWLMGEAIGLSHTHVFPAAALLGIAAALIFSRINPHEAAQYAEAPREPFLRKLRETGSFIWQTLGILGEDRAYRWFALSVFTYGFGNLMTVPLIPLIQVDELHMKPTELAVLSNLTQAVAVIGYFYWGRYVDRNSPQKAVVVNVLLNCLIPVVYIATALFHRPSPWVLIPAFVIGGVVAAGIDMSYFNALLTFAGPDNVSRYQALQSFLLGIRGTIAPFIGGGLAQLLERAGHSSRWVFGLGLVLMLAGAWAQTVAIKRQRQHQAVLDIG